MMYIYIAYIYIYADIDERWLLFQGIKMLRSRRDPKNEEHVVHSSFCKKFIHHSIRSTDWLICCISSHFSILNYILFLNYLFSSSMFLVLLRSFIYVFSNIFPAATRNVEREYTWNVAPLLYLSISCRKCSINESTALSIKISVVFRYFCFKTILVVIIFI